jgi:hypothetical protein
VQRLHKETWKIGLPVSLELCCSRSLPMWLLCLAKAKSAFEINKIKKGM